MMEPLPKARTKKIILRQLDSEIVFYDLDRQQAGTVNPIASKVLSYCDGNHTPVQIRDAIGGTNKISELGVQYILEQLSKTELLEPGYRLNASVPGAWNYPIGNSYFYSHRGGSSIVIGVW